METQVQHSSKTKILDASLHVFRAKGYAATTVESICQQAGVTKGSFFHHFKSKEDLGLAAIAHWEAMVEHFFAEAPYQQGDNPLVRLLGYVEFRASIVDRELSEYTCLLGTLVQEIYATHPDLREACDAGLSSHNSMLAREIEAAKQRFAPTASWSAESVATFIQTVLQGSFIFAKAKQSPEVVRENLDHLRRYLVTLFHQ